jgi:RsiW-degrading membrane proteinase PrsW (M82 family)
MTTVGGNGQLHNYGLIFFICSVGSFIAFLWTLFAIDQQHDSKAFEDNFGEKSSNSRKDLEIENSSEVKQNPIKLLFNLRNVKEIVMTCIKKRDNYVRAQIWLLILSAFCGLFILMSPMSFLFQFVEKMYEWDAEKYSYVNSVGTITHTVITMTVTPIFIKVSIHFS